MIVAISSLPSRFSIINQSSHGGFNLIPIQRQTIRSELPSIRSIMAPTTLTSNNNIFTLQYSSLHRYNNHRRVLIPARVFAKKNDEQQDGGGGGGRENPFGRFKFDFAAEGNVVKSLIPVVSGNSGNFISRRGAKDGNTVFVAGAAGQVGIRVAQTLLRQGFSVRAGVPDLAAAQELARLAATYKIISKEESKRFNAVESGFSQDAESIAKAIGIASKVVITVGAAENGPTAQVTVADAAKVIQAAQLAGVGHVAIIYDPSPPIFASNINVMLDSISSFMSSLFQKSQSSSTLTMKEFLDILVETDVRYTLIKAKLTEDFSPESDYNVVVTAEGGSVGEKEYYKVAKSKIASLVADVFSNTAVAEDKVIEVFTDPDAAARPVSEFLSLIPEDGRRKAYAAAVAKAKAEEEAMIASQKALEAAEAAKKLEQEVKKLEEQEARAASLAEEAQEKAEKAGVSVASLLDKAKDVTSGISWDQLGTQFASSVKINPIEFPNVQIATVRGQAKARNLPSKKAVVKKPAPKEVPRKESRQSESKAEVRKIFGGIFQQETIYVDD